jgi:hypothetical protein
MTTKYLKMPEIFADQFQKEVIHNEALHAIDAILGGGIISRLATPPGSPVEGDCYIVIATASGAWAGKEGTIAQLINAAWLFYTPSEGWTTWVAAENDFVVYDGAKWTRQEVLTVGTETDVFAQCLQVLRNNVVIGWLDNNASNARFKAASGKTVALVNNGNAGLTVRNDNGAEFTGGGIPILPTYVKASLPSAATFARGMIYVSDEVGGATPAFSDGTNWRRVADRAIVA